MTEANILAMTEAQLIAHKQDTCNRFGCTMEQLNKQYAANLQGLERMYNKAVTTDKKVNGYTAEQLLQNVTTYKRLAA